VSDVHALFAELQLREEVVAALRKDATLTGADRDFTLQAAQAHPEDAHALHEAAWAVVKNRGAGKEAYAAALRRAEAATRLAPGDENILRTLGVAQYRLGDPARALDTLEQAEKLHPGQDPVPASLAFLAMAHQQLGHKGEARDTLARLRDVMKLWTWAQNAEAQGMLREAEELIDGKPADDKK
jgi:tetratricopeptide (TPR) repeat protein